MTNLPVRVSFRFGSLLAPLCFLTLDVLREEKCFFSASLHNDHVWRKIP